ncbi:Starch-binding associating with outer membrane [Mariniphaga anaerophila]|uniref:Starch-binding associating with outer membrane n=1 Tax=Mariniphaga anaerophila TaxID=1484053 RepID=A0A1M4WJU1_9BACT|nr:RagB/SusD family nutrient uptake outer membrane protein [Mariniphaga anaerophila]SHE81476.1 Starch-binding associating with outer membrane [Mariniphaga anaerophila]
MKKKFIILLIAIVSFYSCEDILDVTPDGRVTLNEVFQDPELTAKYLSNCYNNIPKKGFWYYFWANIPTGICDETWDCDDGQGLQIAKMYKGMTSSTGHPLEEPNIPSMDGLYWSKYWTQIRTINVFLERIPSAVVETEAIRERWTAEAHVLRAYFFLQLIKWYGGLPIETEAIPLDYDYSKMKRNTFVECAEQIVDDCDFAIQCETLPWRIKSEAEIHRMTKAIAAAIRSEASLFAASPQNNGGENIWEWAYKVNKESLDMLLANGYELYTKVHNTNLYNSAYEEYFVETADLNENPRDRETIWQNRHKAAGHFVIRGFPIEGGYMAGCVPTQELVDAFDMVTTGKPVLNLAKPYKDETKLQPNYNPDSGYDLQNPYKDRDPRFYATVFYNGSYKLMSGISTKIETYVGGNCGIHPNNRSHTRTGYYSKKFMHPESGPLRPQDDGTWKYYRLGAVYLNAAEAAAECGKTDEAMKYVNTIRHRAGFPASVDVKASSKEEAILLVRHERRVELCYEEHRYFDTRRWSMPDEDNIVEKFSTGMEITKNADNTFSYKRILVGTLDSSSPSKMSYERKYHWMPIPLAEVSKLETQTGQKWQNPGW